MRMAMKWHKFSEVAPPEEVPLLSISYDCSEPEVVCSVYPRLEYRVESMCGLEARECCSYLLYHRHNEDKIYWALASDIPLPAEGINDHNFCGICCLGYYPVK